MRGIRETLEVGVANEYPLRPFRRQIGFGEIVGVPSAWAFFTVWLFAGVTWLVPASAGPATIILSAVVIATWLGRLICLDYRQFPAGTVIVDRDAVTSTAQPGGELRVPFSDVEAVLVAGGHWGPILVVRRRRRGLFRGPPLVIHAVRADWPLELLGQELRERAAALPAAATVAAASDRWARFERRRVSVAQGASALAVVLAVLGLLIALLAA